MTTSKITSLLCFTGLAALATAVVPDGYVLQVTPKCGSDPTIENAEIHILTDLNVEARASCVDGEYIFTTTDDVNFFLPVSYPQQSSRSCVFKQRQNSLVFFVSVKISYGEEDNLVHQEEEEFTITCTFSPKATHDSEQSNVLEGLIAPTEFYVAMGADSSSNFSVELVDVLGNSLSGKDLALGKMVRLKGSMTAAGDEVGLLPVNCVAIDGNARYAVLRAGCGDGIIFGKDEGFTTNGTDCLSPYFPTFSINAGPVIKFECNFVACVIDCNGNSCHMDTTTAVSPTSIAATV